MSRLSEQIDDTRDVEIIKSIQFSIMSPEEIRKGSVVEVTVPETYEGSQPKVGGLFDPRMGVIDDVGICATCENKAELCPGHFGHIDLALPVFNIQYIDMVIKILRCVCFRCSKLLVNKSSPQLLQELSKKNGKSRFSIIYKYSQKIKKCQHNDGCMVIQPKKYSKKRPDSSINFEKAFINQILVEFPPEAIKDNKIVSSKQIFTPEICLMILKKITNEDCEFLGFSSKYSRPDWMIFTVFPVPPPAMRPSVKPDNNQRSEDDLTILLASIVKNNKLLKQKIDANADKKQIDTYYGLLQYCIICFIDNKVPGMAPYCQRSQRPLKTIVERQVGKDGRIRGNIMGKRVDFSARSVISVDPNISIDEFGVPKEIAMNLTFPEIVTKYNIREMYELIRNGPNIYPGAKSVKKLKYDCNGNPSPCVITLKYVDVNTIILNEGDVVNRHLRDGDVCLFNRQPSLHRMSMMGMRARILPGKTFKLNVSACAPFNADFDGDEMNAHVPGSILAHEELRNIAIVPKQIISPSRCQPIIKLVQDTLVGAYLMSQDSISVDRRKINNLMMNIKSFSGVLPPADFKTEQGVEKWTGKTAYSLILPEVNLNTSNNSDEKVVIKNGKYISGTLDSKIIGTGGLIQDLMNMYNIDRCHTFIDETQNIVVRWLEEYGFSVGVGDCILKSRELNNELYAIIDKNVKEADRNILLANQGLYETKLDDELRIKSIDLLMSKIASDCENDVTKYLKSKTNNENRFKNMFIAGAKGDPSGLNLRQIMGVVGQITVWGSRVQNGYNDRTLPHFHRYDIGLSAKGFVRNSFAKGLTPSEFFFSMMGGRTGSIDTAVKTAETGYISRRLMKATEDVKVMYDGTVRNSSNAILQFVYGDDNYDPIKLERVEVPLIGYNNLMMENKYLFNRGIKWNTVIQKSAETEMNKEAKKAEYWNMLDAEYAQLMQYRGDLRNKYYLNTDIIIVTTFMPFNLGKFIPSVKNRFNISENSVSDINPLYIIKKVNELCNSVTKYMRSPENNILTKIIIKTFLASKVVIVEHKLSKAAFDYIITWVENKIFGAFVQSGEMVGPVAAQSMGEANTQLTLNTFHKAGASIGSVVVTSGLPRMKEIINLSKAMKVPSMRLYIKPELSGDQKKVDDIKNKIEFTKLRDVVAKTSIIYENLDEEGILINNQEDMEFIKMYYEFEELIGMKKNEGLSKWVLRIEFDREMMMTKNILMNDIQDAILKDTQQNDDIQCIINDDNSANLIMRIRIRNDNEDSNFLLFLKELEKQILDMTLRGVPNVISGSGMETINLIKYGPDGSHTTVKEWVINTNGTNLTDVMLLDAVDKKRSFTNDIIETYEIFGIEGVRTRIIQELDKVFDSKINYRHISLIADVMTYRGTLMQIDRHGINRCPDNSVIGKASFEEVTDIFTKAAMHSEVDKMTGVSANIMFGQVAPCGTNVFDIILDEERLMKYIEDINMEEDGKNEIVTLQSGVTETEVMNEISETYEKMEEYDRVKDSDFDFGYSANVDNNLNIMPIMASTIGENNETGTGTETEVVKIVNKGNDVAKSASKKIKIKKNI